MTNSWLLNTQEGDITAPCHCEPDVPVQAVQLEACLVYTRTIDTATLHEQHPTDEESRTYAQRLAWNLGYKALEQVTLTLESKDEIVEHLNVDEQMRIVESGVIFVDVRDGNDQWVRVQGTEGDVIVIPPGIYHRVVPAGTTPVKVLRMLRRSEVFRPIPRDTTGLDEKLVDEAQEAHEEHMFALAHPPVETAMGPANDCDNILVKDPRDFDATLEKVKAGLRPGDILVVLIKGLSNPRTHKSWCPPCVVAEPMVQRAVQAAKQKRHVVYMQCNVERSVYLGNPNYLYRTHPFIKVVGIPHFMVFEQRGSDLTEICRESTPCEAYETWVEKL
ncbi:unnamed protein product [Trypanosoma congolense IL3000]|uniref:acireductone dioxygenase (Fe(2+)-requiring) n=1 Tax=Trypanosoma congolense (strain IL3000) TaxID=1068625 RepID=F9W3Q0_TRYCI|nr:unnamed protein product [Trypanosoma congolense IL3000]